MASAPHYQQSAMLRALVYGLTLLHLGPGFAFALLAFGCDATSPAIGAVCAMSAFTSFSYLTVGAWVVFGCGALALHLVGKARATAEGGRALRAWSLLLLLSFGVLVGAATQVLTGSQFGFLAIPASLCAGWLFLANPQACLASGTTRANQRGP
jgi:hypothetical protein